MKIQISGAAVAKGSALTKSNSAARSDRVDRPAAVDQRLGQQRAGKDHHIDQKEQPDQQRTERRLFDWMWV